MLCSIQKQELDAEMAQLTDQIKKFIQERYDAEYDGSVGVLSSLAPDGTPNSAPKHFRIADDEQLEFTDVFSTTLGTVLKDHPEVTVVFFDPKAVIGYRFKGKALMENTGFLFERAVSHLQEMGFKPKAIVKVKIDEIRFLQYGPDAGKKLA